MRGVRAWRPVTNPTARALAGLLCALWGRLESACGGRLLPACGAFGVGRSPAPDLPYFGACGWGPLPTGCGCGGCGRGDPSPTPQRALLRAGVARCGVGTRAPGGAPLAWVLGLRGRALSHPLPPVLWGVRPGPTTHWLWVQGGGGAGTRHQRHSARSCELALRAVGAAPGRPKGSPLAWVWGVPSRALFPPRPPFFWGVRPGPTTHWLWVRAVRAWEPVTNPQRALLRAGFPVCGGGTRASGWDASCLGVRRPGLGTLPAPTARPFGRAAGAHHPLAASARGAGVGTRHQPHSARSCKLALHAVGAARGRPGGAPNAWLWGVRGGALSHPQPPVLLSVRPGPTSRWLRVQGVRAWRSVTNPTARALASWLCAL